MKVLFQPITLLTTLAILTGPTQGQASIVERDFIETTNITVRCDLPANANTGDRYRIESKIIDPLGDQHDIFLDFTQTNPLKWNFTIIVPNAQENGVTQTSSIRNGEPYTNMEIQFDTNGRLWSYNNNPLSYQTPPSIVINWRLETLQNSIITLDFGAILANNAIRIMGESFFFHTPYHNGRERPAS